MAGAELGLAMGKSLTISKLLSTLLITVISVLLSFAWIRWGGWALKFFGIENIFLIFITIPILLIFSLNLLLLNIQGSLLIRSIYSIGIAIIAFYTAFIIYYIGACFLYPNSCV